MINPIIYSSKTDLWSTPQNLFDKLNEKYKFNLDVCATAENAKCTAYFTPEIDGLKQSWIGYRCWMNPPYGKEIVNWLKKAYNESRDSNTIVVALLPSRTDTRWFHNYIYMKDGISIEFIKGRLKFGNCTSPAPFPSMLVIFKCST